MILTLIELSLYILASMLLLDSIWYSESLLWMILYSTAVIEEQPESLQFCLDCLNFPFNKFFVQFVFVVFVVVRKKFFTKLLFFILTLRVDKVPINLWL